MSDVPLGEGGTGGGVSARARRARSRRTKPPSGMVGEGGDVPRRQRRAASSRGKRVRVPPFSSERVGAASQAALLASRRARRAVERGDLAGALRETEQCVRYAQEARRGAREAMFAAICCWESPNAALWAVELAGLALRESREAMAAWASASAQAEALPVVAGDQAGLVEAVGALVGTGEIAELRLEWK